MMRHPVRKRLIVLALTLLLLCGTVTASAAGSASDPLVSKSYADSWASSLVEDAAEGIDAALRPAFEQSGQSGGSARVSLSAGQVLSLKEGASVTLLSGSATVSITSGAFLNVSVGGEATNGRINPNQMYIVCEGSSASVTASSASTLLVGGSYSASSALTFSDVPAGSWYAEYVYAAVDLGLIDGVAEGRYGPDESFTLAQAIKIAACMHQLYHEGAVTLTNGSPWYTTYVDYAVRNGIAPESYGALSRAEYDSPISRRDYVRLFYNALPASEYLAINNIADGAIPDVAAGSIGSEEIYAFYRAGILDGSLADGSFLPDSGIKRSEVAAIIARMFDDSLRKSVTLG